MNTLYPVVRPLLFSLDAEQAHTLTLKSLNALNSLHIQPTASYNSTPTNILGLQFANPLGLAAGLDKNGDYIDSLGALGFGFIELGTITPRPQAGNPKPRMFRLPKAKAVINRMGFNNKGVDHLVAQVKKRRFRGICGINIGKNFDTPLENAHEDYLTCFDKVYQYADYIVVNVSSPNTKGLRDLQQSDSLAKIISVLLESRESKQTEVGKKVPILVKFAPDLSDGDLQEVGHLCQELQVDGIIATNTTISRTAVEGLEHSEEKGGLSGAPLTQRSQQAVRALRQAVGPDYPIIGVGGILSGADAKAMVDAGANLVQVYTGLVYRGPALISEILDSL